MTIRTPSRPSSKPFRFGTGPGRIADRAELVASAREIEALGYSTFCMADHFMIAFAPLVALQAAADATHSLRVTQLVLDQDFRHPAILAKELATLDVLSEGRLQIGIGAGWMQSEYEQAGLTYDPASVRIERLEEVVTILKGLFAEEPFSYTGKHFAITGLKGTPRPLQLPHPPIMIGGGGRKLLSVAGRQADIVQIMPRIGATTGPTGPGQFSGEAYLEKVAWVREAAGDRFEQIELGAQLAAFAITDDPDAAFDQFYERFRRRLDPSTDDAAMRKTLRHSPMVVLGSLDEVCAQLGATRAEYGFSYWTTPVGAKPDLLAPVIRRLAGT